MIRAGHDKEIVSLTGSKATILADLGETINNATGRGSAMEKMPFDKYAKESAGSEEGGKSEWWFE